MKKFFLFTFTIFLLIQNNITPAQTAKKSWSFGFGFTYPRFLSSDVKPDNSNYGGYISLQHNFSDFVALRILADYNHITALTTTFRGCILYNVRVPFYTQSVFSNLMTGNLDLLYYFAPCSWLSPYTAFGFGLVHYTADWGKIQNPKTISKTTLQLNYFLGSEWNINAKWKLKTEIGINSIDSQVDGVINNNRKGIFGSNADSYITLSIGIQYYFYNSVPSKICDLYEGIKIKKPKVDIPSLDEIESIIKKHLPKK